MKQVVLTPNQILYQPAKPVGEIDKSIKTVIKEMKQAIISATNPKGVGLAAPQIGYSLQIFVIKPRDNSPVSFFINPQVVNIVTKTENRPKQKTPLEGCLSIPNTWGLVKRNQEITLKYFNLKNKEKVKTFRGFSAIIIQHEMDHLQGILFTKRVLEQQGRLYEIIKDENGKEKLNELPL